jgi:hypothetical protein
MRYLLLLALATANPAPDQELSLGGIVLGQSELSVIQALGSPKSRAEGDSDYLPVKLSYSGLTVLLDEQGVGGLISTSKRFCTPAGVCPGTTYAKAQQIYGSALVTEIVGGLPVGYVYGDGCWLEFAQNSGKVQTIELACSP